MSRSTQRLSLTFTILMAVAVCGGNAAFADETAAQLIQERNGQHDFDFIIGIWKVHLRRLDHPLTKSKTWIEYDGTSIVRQVWSGRANLEEFEADSVAKDAHIEGLTLRLYDPKSNQWSLYWANSRVGRTDPPMTGRFVNGRGEFYDQEFFDGHAIYVRYVWSEITARTARFEQSYSADGGRTWEPNWTAAFVRDGN